MSKFTFVVLFGNGTERDVVVEADSERQAASLVWSKLTDAEKDAVESTECVDVAEVAS